MVENHSIKYILSVYTIYSLKEMGYELIMNTIIYNVIIKFVLLF